MGCPDKTHYPTRAEAVWVAAVRVRKASAPRRLRVYACPCGGGFCLTKLVREDGRA